MAIYRIYPVQDAFINSQKPTANTGLDEILEIGGYPYYGDGKTSRILTKFKDQDITSVLEEKVSGPFSASLHMTLATGYQAPLSYSIEAYPLAESWENGTGKFGDSPVNTTGVSWGRKTTLLNWTTGSYGVGITGSYESDLPGGGSWYTGSNGLNLSFRKTYEYLDNQDLSIDIKQGVLAHYSGTIENQGFIIKTEDSIEFNPSSSIYFKYFGKETNTIYSPYLEFKWDDSTYVTGSSSVLGTTQHTIKLKNGKEKYVDEGVSRFRISARPKYPVRVLTTGSIYSQNYSLPENSYWGLKDEFTDRMTFNFDENYTKISCDSTGPYFDIYIDTLQPERHYRVLIKTTIDGSTEIIDTGNTFKVVRNG